MKITHIPKKISLYLIKVYQTTLSPDHGPNKKYFPEGYCPFTPSCSQYGYEAIEKYGFVRGWIRALWRIVRCNPCTKGGFDKP